MLFRSCRLIVVIDQVALDLHPGQGPIDFEAGLRKHRFEDVQAQLHLAPVLLPVYARVGGPLDVFAHYADATGLLASAQELDKLPYVTLDRWTEIYGFIAAVKIKHHRDEFRSDQVELRLGAASAVLNNFSLFIPNPQPDWGAENE